ncbi:phage tail protein, partial [Escherichia coli]|nr:phage tail protein [Escherichia coli]
MEDASLTTKGVVKLSSAVDSTSESLAATPKAVKAANDNANSRVPSNRKINGKALTADITLTPKDIGTLNSVTMSFSGGAGWFKLATVTMPQASSIVYITLIGGAGYNVNSPMQAGISELVLRAGNGNPKGLTGALWRRTSVGFTNFAWVNTSGDTYDIYVEIGNYATSVNVHWDCTANASVSIYTSPTYSASKPASVTDGVVYTMYSSHQKPTPSDIGALPTTGGTVSGPLSVTGGLTGSLNGNASTATKLQTTRTIGGVGFDGSANINLPGVNTTGNQNTTGNAATATKLQTARTIGGVSFDGTANINLPGVNTTGNQNTTGNAATATKLQTARTINGVSFDGSANISLSPANIGCPASPTGWLTTGSNGGAITTAQLVTLLQNNGAFNTKAWIARCAWAYANSATIPNSETGCG